MPVHVHRCADAEVPFHGDNTGSNPVGDANLINDLWNCRFWRATGYATVELLDHSTMGISLLFRHSFVVDIHRDRVRGMPQQALYHFWVVVVLAKQGRERRNWPRPSRVPMASRYCDCSATRVSTKKKPSGNTTKAFKNSMCS